MLVSFLMSSTILQQISALRLIASFLIAFRPSGDPGGGDPAVGVASTGLGRRRRRGGSADTRPNRLPGGSCPAEDEDVDEEAAASGEYIELNSEHLLTG